jgi:hypothetical protein
MVLEIVRPATPGGRIPLLAIVLITGAKLQNNFHITKYLRNYFKEKLKLL